MTQQTGKCVAVALRWRAMTLAHQIATRAVGGTVSVSVIRDPADGSARYTVSYQSRGDRWQSRHRFQDIGQAEAGALSLSDFLGAEYRGAEYGS